MRGCETMKVLWVSDSPQAPSGFGNVTRFVCDGLVRHGHDVHILGWQCEGTSHRWRDATVHPIGWHPLGADVLLGYLYRLRPDVIITLGDIWWFSFMADPALDQFLAMTGTPWLLYFPVDGHRPDGALPPSWLEILRRVDAPVAMSEYGRRTTRNCGLCCEYIPHGVDLSVFRPAADKRAAKGRLGYEDRFVILSDARNQPRKMLPRLLSIVERFARDKADVLLHLHCDANDPATNEDRYNYRIAEDVRALGLADCVRFTHEFSLQRALTLDELVQLYQAADVHLLVSSGEGFGLPTLQASACGVVPLAPDYTANQELIDGHGVLLPVLEFVPDEFGIGRAFVDIAASTRALDDLYWHRRKVQEYSLAASRFAESYDWPLVIQQWVALLHRTGHAQRPSARARSVWGRQAVVTVNSLGLPLQQKTARAPAGGEPTYGMRAASVVEANIHGLPNGARVTIQLNEQNVGEVTRQLYEDTRQELGSPRLNIPIIRTEREADDGRPRVRARGSVYVQAAGASTASAFVGSALQLMFPVIFLWSDDTESDPESPPRPRQPRHASEAWLRKLACAILAIDVDGAFPELPVWTAHFGVPTIGSAGNPLQRLYWPLLAVERSDVALCVRRARDVLTDYTLAAGLSAEAARSFNRFAPRQWKERVAATEATRHSMTGVAV